MRPGYGEAGGGSHRSRGGLRSRQGDASAAEGSDSLGLMKGPGSALILLGLGILAAACASPSPAAATQDVQDVGSTPAPGAAPPEAVPAPSEPAGTPTKSTTAPPAEPLLGRDHRSVVACSSDADCGWDDTCTPTRCVEHGPPSACDESTKPPGTCSCFEGSCTLKPDTPPPPSGTCEPRACALDRAAGRCVADDGGVVEGLRSTPALDVGPSCDCIDPAKGCTFQWFEPVPCKTTRDCWVDPSPRRHPIARPKHLRKRDFKPCADGEAAPLCSADGQCVVGPAFSC